MTTMPERGNDGDWLWGELMDFCKKHGWQPARVHDLFDIPGRLRKRSDANRAEAKALLERWVNMVELFNSRPATQLEQDTIAYLERAAQ